MEKEYISLQQCFIINIAICMSIQFTRVTTFMQCICCIAGTMLGTIIGYYASYGAIRLIKRISKKSTHEKK